MRETVKKTLTKKTHAIEEKRTFVFAECSVVECSVDRVDDTVNNIKKRLLLCLILAYC